MTILHIDRSEPFRPAFWPTVEEDKRSLNLHEVDLTKVTLVTVGKVGEISVSGEEILKRLKEIPAIRLDAKVLHILVKENEHLIPENWKKYRPRGILFPGTIFQDGKGHRYMPGLQYTYGWYIMYCPHYTLKYEWPVGIRLAVLVNG